MKKEKQYYEDYTRIIDANDLEDDELRIILGLILNKLDLDIQKSSYNYFETFELVQK